MSIVDTVFFNAWLIFHICIIVIKEVCLLLRNPFSIMVGFFYVRKLFPSCLGTLFVLFPYWQCCVSYIGNSVCSQLYQIAIN